MDNEFYIREFQRGDEAGLIACVKDEYAYTYFKRWFYDEAAVRKAAGINKFFVACRKVRSEEQREDVKGFVMVQKNKRSCEICSLIVRKECRGKQLSRLLMKKAVDYVRTIAEMNAYQSAYVLPVAFHTITQKLFAEAGFIAAGAELGVFDSAAITTSYDMSQAEKYAKAVMVKPLKSVYAGTLYVPLQFLNICMDIYGRLKVSCRFSGEKKKPWKQHSVVDVKMDAGQSNICVKVRDIGMDIMQTLKEYFRLRPLEGRWTANLYINMQSEAAVYLAEIIMNQQWCFTGFYPLCGEGEYIIFHNAGKQKAGTEKQKFIPEVENVISYNRK